MTTRNPRTRRTSLVESLENRQLMAGQQVFVENFEGGGQGWHVDTDLATDGRKPWAIVSNFAHAGSRSASTVNAGNDAILASPAINLPSANQYTDHLYLRWWQQTDMSSRGGRTTDIAVVREYIPELGGYGPWNVIDPNTEAVPQQTNGWGYVGLDLTQFAGERVQIGFHHYVIAPLNGARGWSVDDVSITKEAVQRPWAADTSFENGFDGWTTTRGLWDVGTPTGIGVPTGHKVAGTGISNSPVIGEFSSLISPAFMIPAAAANKPMTLQFNSYMDKTSAAVITVEFQFWMPSTGWSPVNNLSADLTDTVLNLYQPAGRWKTFPLPVTNSFGGAQHLPFRVLFSVLGGSGGRGWFIDDVKLNFAGKGTQTNPTPTTGPEIHVSNPFGELTDGVTRVMWGTHKPGSGAKDITFTVRNSGNTTLNLNQLVLDNSVGFTIVKQPAKTVAAGGSTTFTIRMSTATAGTKSATVRLLSNDADEATFNFNISGLVKM
jgi:hypothetical protein